MLSLRKSLLPLPLLFRFLLLLSLVREAEDAYRGAIDTPMSRDVPPVMLERLALAQAATPLGRQGKAEEAAKLTAFLLSDESSYTTGGVHVLDGGLDA